MRPHIDILREKGFKITPLRKAMLDIFQTKRSSLTPEELFGFVKKQVPGAGLQSVYRNLNDFSKAGIAEEIFHNKRKSVYALCHEIEDHHHHAVCRKCGRTEEIKNCNLKSVAKTLNQSLRKAKIGFRIEHHFLQLEGLCRACQK